MNQLTLVGPETMPDLDGLAHVLDAIVRQHHGPLVINLVINPPAPRPEPIIVPIRQREQPVAAPPCIASRPRLDAWVQDAIDNGACFE
jgi:hypothetical protein